MKIPVCVKTLLPPLQIKVKLPCYANMLPNITTLQ